MTQPKPTTPAQHAMDRLTQLKGVSIRSAEALYGHRRCRSFPASTFGYGSLKSRNRLGSLLRHSLVEWVAKGSTIRITAKAKELISK